MFLLTNTIVLMEIISLRTTVPIIMKLYHFLDNLIPFNEYKNVSLNIYFLKTDKTRVLETMFYKCILYSPIG